MLQQHAPTETHILPQQAIRDPFVLEFLELKDEYSESDFEEALINHLMDFMLELGDDLPLLVGSEGYALMTTGFVSICCFSTAVYAAY